MVTLTALLVEDLDSDWQGLQPNPDIVVYVALVNCAETTLAENVVGAEALGDGLQLVECKGDDVGVKHGIVPGFIQGRQI